MRRLFISLLLCVPVWTQAQEVVNHVGLYVNETASICQAPLQAPMESLTLKIIAVLPELSGGITAAEFRVDNLPPNDGAQGGIWSVNWNTNLVIGDIETGVALAFSPPVSGTYVELGEISFFSTTEHWPGPDHVMPVMPYTGQESVLVVDTDYIEHPAAGDTFTINCGDPGGCECLPGPAVACELIPPELDFGVVEEYKDSIRSFVIRNTGTALLEGGVTEECDNYYLMAGGGSYSLLPGEEREVVVRFAPLESGYLACAVQLGDSNCGPLICTGVGTYSPPHCEIEPSTVEFGAVGVGTTGDSSFTVANTGAWPFSVSLPEYPCPGGPFTIPDHGSLVVHPDQVHEVTVLFTPQSVGEVFCEFDVGLYGCDDLTLHGTGTESIGVCDLSATHLDFPDTLPGEFYDLGLNIMNTGSGPITGAVSLDSPQFSLILGEGPYDLLPGEVHPVIVRFQPQASGQYDAILALGSDDCDDVPLSGLAPDEVLITNHIGLYLDDAATECVATLDGPGQSVVVRVLAVLPDFTSDGITAAEFRIDNLPAPEGGASWQVAWNTPLVIGDVESGIALAFSGPPLAGPIVELGQLTFTNIDVEDWLGPDHRLSVEPSADGGVLVVVDEHYDTLPVAGGLFTFNCSDPGACNCLPSNLPVCLVEPTHLDFGELELGDYALEQVRVRNVGSAPFSGDLSSDCNGPIELISAEGPYTLDPGEWRTLQVRFQPVAAGDYQCGIDTGTPFCADVSCTGSAAAGPPICEVTPTVLAFDDLLVGETQDLQFSIHNAGESDLQGNLSESSEHFSLETPGSFTVAPGATLHVTVRFAPQSAGDHEAVVDLGNDGCSTVNCFGGAEVPVAGCALEPDDLDFGEVVLGYHRDRQFQIKNTGQTILTGNVVVSGEGYSIVSGGGSFSLNPFAHRNVTLRYTPTAEAEQLGQVTFGNEFCVDLPCRGTGVVGQPACDLVPAALDFGAVLFGSPRDAEFDILNTGNVPISGLISLAGDQFEVTGGGGSFVLLPGATRTVTVRFDAAYPGQHEAVVELGSDICADLPLSGYSGRFSADGDQVGLFADPAGELCAADLPPDQWTDLHLLALLPGLGAEGAEAFEFRLDGLPEDPGGELWSVDWAQTPVSGDLPGGVRIELPSPQYGLVVSLGVLHLNGDGADWVGMNQVLQVEHSSLGGRLLMETFPEGAWDLYGGHLTLNCDDPALCDCTDFGEALCEFSHDLLDFGELDCGDTSSREFTLTNTGNGPLSGTLSIEGENFLLTQGAGAFTLYPDEVLEARAYFLAGPAGVYEGAVHTGLPGCPELPCVGTSVSSYSGRQSPFIGMFSEENAVLCHADLNLFSTTTVYFFAVLPWEIPAITAAEFRVDNWVDSEDAIITENWNTDLVIGDPEYGIALAFSEPIPGPIALLGTVDFFGLRDIGHDYVMDVLESIHSGQRVVVDLCYDTINADGGLFTFNCSTGQCLCTAGSPVTLSGFTLSDEGGAVDLSWSSETAGELEFMLEAEREGRTWRPEFANFLPGEYLCRDESPELAEPGEVTYRLSGRLPGEAWQLLREESLDLQGIRYPTRLLSPHPNPFNPKVMVPFSLAEAGRARVTVYDIAGRHVASLVDDAFERGEHELVWQGRDDAGREVGSGIYFVKLEAKGISEVEKLVLLR